MLCATTSQVVILSARTAVLSSYNQLVLLVSGIWTLSTQLG
ncbi:hypothetical protein PI124_g1321 [Phytophthora idaei]|nr:hypothetical protein PI125_g14103 [Phytophthora idaei]KAG3155749.1 hypothetical protein PI126_g9031 [Phytophthora idaei]KAG3254124.1 hypothetical protein PI124_g1321 [Phytophthora idaei]